MLNSPDLSPRPLLHIATHPRDASRAQYPEGDSANSRRVSERGARRRSRRLVSLTGASRGRFSRIVSDPRRAISLASHPGELVRPRGVPCYEGGAPPLPSHPPMRSFLFLYTKRGISMRATREKLICGSHPMNVRSMIADTSLIRWDSH